MLVFFLLCAGGTLFNVHHNLVSGLTIAYPDHKWIHCLFKMCSKGAWKNPQNLRDYFEYCKTKLEIVDVADWRRISSKQFSELGGMQLQY